MQKWKYHTLVVRELSIAENKLNAEGERGWELVSVVMEDARQARAFFKAPLDAVILEETPAQPAAPEAPARVGITHPSTDQMELLKVHHQDAPTAEAAADDDDVSGNPF